LQQHVQHSLKTISNICLLSLQVNRSAAAAAVEEEEGEVEGEGITSTSVIYALL
jgi:hypothetical protein